ncbi:hypothetical protein [Paenibacillus harenae]|uniref:hypothetical protein n=1 Tax=Paenibacillus harenae TaxID=306543 RepID=UPI0012EB421F|nr:hypothetical protein [Paenibacillus harenae]
MPTWLIYEILGAVTPMQCAHPLSAHEISTLYTLRIWPQSHTEAIYGQQGA